MENSKNYLNLNQAADNKYPKANYSIHGLDGDTLILATYIVV